MDDTTTVNVRLSKQVKDRLDALAERTKHSRSYLAEQAITSYVDANAWQVDIIDERVRELKAGAPTVSHDDVAGLVRSWVENDTAARRESSDS
ncbi:MAG: ribbon-helix-helix protein, CopG family [Rhodospirillales bacterium]|nr:ribbon-helix-helix protein, CopG family [Rhodospirillales bacterium]